ncbi:MAG: hypothetical protein M3440_08465 [Chloroflexota bacterium]|nr:hypothetical protein [Chloroflexota bacterium]
MSGTTPEAPRPRRRRSGASLNWDADDIAQAATVGPGDADAAEASWNRFAPAAARGLLSAREQEPDDERTDTA